ncbi:MAG: phospho-N-acetylmuramoyl-pentapeptide-transferase [Lachnospiraceae bacterium]|nr:phospho-N-acetylmuramoyl-pentapeptide-transferase [Lachnospiraceae bacterium]
MLYQLLSDLMSNNVIIAIGAAFSLIATYLLLRFPPKFLPRDHGRAFAVNGELSKGKLRGVGLIIVAVFLAALILFFPISIEYYIYGAIIFLMMLSGYLDDASKNPWSDYKKGAIDLLLSIMMVVTFLMYNDSYVVVLKTQIPIHPVIYGILGIILIWVSVNVTNCSDGVDGLCGSVSVVAFIAYFLIFGKGMFFSDRAGAVFFAASLLAYLRFNWHPSTMLMGDAGSRAIGIYLALLAMKSMHPFSFLLIGLVFILDGGLGLVKVFIMRFLKIPFLKNIRCPIHDHLRKNKGWKDVPVVLFMIGSEIVMCVIMGVLMYVVHRAM